MRPNFPPILGRGLVAVFAVALAVRGIHVAQIGKSPFARILVGDARSYDRWAHEIAGGAWLGTTTFYQAPLYPYALGTLHAMAGRDPMRVRYVQAAIGALACVLVALAGRFWFGPREGLAAGALLALYPPAIFFDGLLQKAVLDNLLMCALLAILGAYIGAARRGLLLAAGVALGAFALSRENALVFGAVLVAWIPIHLRERPWRERWSAVGLFAAGLALVLVPVGIRNLAVGGEFLITTSQAGPNFFIGNNENATGRYVPLRSGREMPEFERIDATALAESATGRSLSAGEVSSYWWRRSFRWIRGHPGAWLELVGRKALLTWNRVELPDTESLSVHRDASWVLRVLGGPFGFGVLAPLGIAGIVLAWKRRPSAALPAAMLLAFSAAVALFYVFARYRFPMVPILVLFAAHALIVSWDRVRSGNARSLAPALASGLLAAIAVNFPLVSMAEERGRSYTNLGIALAEDGRTSEAIVYYRKAIDLAPSDAAAHANLGAALARIGRVEDAGTALVTALRIDPALIGAHRALGLLLAQRGDFVAAERHFRDIVRQEPDSLVDRTDLANTVLEQGRVEEAMALYRAVLASDERYLDARLNLVQTLVRLGRRDEAFSEAREAVRLSPESADARAVSQELEGRR